MFCREYLVDLNLTQAAMRAGYSEKYANREASRLWSKVDIQQRISELNGSRNHRTDRMIWRREAPSRRGNAIAIITAFHHYSLCIIAHN